MLRRNVLIFHAAALGDFVLTWPLAVGLARIYAQSRIVYVTGREKGLLAERVLRLESADIEGGWHHLYADDAAGLPERAAKLLAGAHAVYALGRMPAAWRANVGRLNPAASVIEVCNADDAANLAAGHESERLVAALSADRPAAEATRQILRSVADRGIGYARRAGSTVLIHPGAGSPDKCWPADRFADLAERLTAAGRPVRFVIGEVERDRWSTATVERLAAVAEVRQPATLTDLLHEVAAAAVFVGNDSGPAHLAGILGVPTVAVFGPTAPARWRPLGPDVRTIGPVSLPELPVEAVWSILNGQPVGRE